MTTLKKTIINIQLHINNSFVKNYLSDNINKTHLSTSSSLLQLAELLYPPLVVADEINTTRQLGLFSVK